MLLLHHLHACAIGVALHVLYCNPQILCARITNLISTIIQLLLILTLDLGIVCDNYVIGCCDVRTSPSIQVTNRCRECTEIHSVIVASFPATS